MVLKYAEILNFDSIIREWIEIANELFGTRGCIEINDPGISPYREPGAMKTLVSLLGVMRTIKGRLPEDKRMDFEDWCFVETYVQYGAKYHLLKEMCDSANIDDVSQQSNGKAIKIKETCCAIVALFSSVMCTQSLARTSGMWSYGLYGSNGSCDKAFLESPAVPKSTSGAITIPSSLDGYPVARIGQSAFSGCRSLTSVTIPCSVEEIRSLAFKDCVGLKSITIPGSVVEIGSSAFLDCTGLTNVVIRNGVKRIANSAFSGCCNMLGVTIPDSVTFIRSGAFTGCNLLYDTTLISGVSIVDGWVVDSSELIAGHLDLKGIRGIGECAFYNRTGLKSVIIPGGAHIGSEAFNNCRGLNSVIISDGVTDIGSNAFSGCSGLTCVTIPNSVIDIGPNAFSGCNSIVNVFITGIKQWCNVKMYNGSNPLEDHECAGLYLNGSLITDLRIPDGVTSIGGYTFRGYRALHSVIIPEGVTSISSSAFDGCSGLTCVTMSSRFAVREVFGSAKTNIVSVTISSGDTIISGAFYGCGGLTSVTMPDSINSIGSSAFYGCSGLTSVTIPNGVTSIGDYAFFGCSGLMSITIPNSVKSVGNDAFKNCGGLRTVVFDGNAPSVGTRTFTGVSSNCLVRVLFGSTGWGVDIPGIWNGLPIDYTVPAVKFNANGGVLAETERVTNDGVVGELPIPTRAGYSFAGWFTAADGGEKIETGMALDASVRVWAHWAANEYVVSFDTSGGAFAGGEKKINVVYDAKYGQLPTPARAGYSFSGWLFNGNKVTSQTIVKTTSDHTLVASWAPNQYSVTYDANGGSVAGSTSKNVTFDSTYGSLPTPTRAGYSFAGWTLDGEPIFADMVVSTAGNHTLVAQWTINQYNVRFDANGGIGGYETVQDYGTEIVPPVVVRTGCTFEGWMPGVAVTVPASNVTYKAKWKFWSVMIDSTAQSIRTLYPNDYANITNITFAMGVTNIPRWFFDGCNSIRIVSIPDSVTNIADYAFAGCPNLQAEVWGGYKVLDGWLIGYTDGAGETIPDADKLKGICSEALKGCTALRRLEFGDGSRLVSVGAEALKGCTELKTLVLPPSLTRIGDEAFMGCSYLDNVIVPGGVKSIGSRAFKNCTGFTWAQIEHGVESIGEEAFYGCWRITEVDIPSSVAYIGGNVFGGDSSITKVALRGDCRQLYGIFSNYGQITEATVKPGTGAVVDGLFNGCSRLAKVTFLGNCPELLGNNIYAGTPYNLVTYVDKDSTGWDGTPGSHVLPMQWPLSGSYRREIKYTSDTSKAYTVTFDANGGTPKTQKVAQHSETPFALPSTPKRTDYVFTGWWTEKNGGVRVTTDTVFIVGVYETLYAHWKEVEIYVGDIDDCIADDDGSFVIWLDDEWLALSKLTVKGLPPGVKFDAKTGLIYGTVTKPGVYKVAVSAKSAEVTKPVTAEFEIVVPNLASEVLPNLAQDKDAYGVVMCGVTINPKLVNCKPEGGWTVKVAGLPAGLKYDAKTGTITGVPTKAGTFTVTFTATKKDVKDKEVATITLTTEALPLWATGTFTGYANDGDDYGSATMTVAANGKVSGKVALDGTNWTFGASSFSRVEGLGDARTFVIEAEAKSGKATKPVVLTVGGVATPLVNAVAEGTFGNGEMKLWRNIWKDKATASEAKATIEKFIGVYTVSVADGADYGSGYISLTVGKDGNVKASGKLADGTSASATSPLMYDEAEGWFAMLYAAPSAYKGGAFAVAVSFGERLAPAMFAPQWTSRNVQATGVYGEGFARYVDLAGAYYNKLDTLRKYYESLRLGLDGAPGLGFTFRETSLNEQGRKVTTSSAATASAVNTLWQDGLTAGVNGKGAFVVTKATKPVQDRNTKEWSYNGVNDGAMTLSFTQATGIFKGSYTFWYDYESAFDATKDKATMSHTSKKVSFEGIFVQGEESMRGFYLWDATGSYADPKTGKPKTYKYKESYGVTLSP